MAKLPHPNTDLREVYRQHDGVDPAEAERLRRARRVHREPTAIALTAEIEHRQAYIENQRRAKALARYESGRTVALRTDERIQIIESHGRPGAMMTYGTVRPLSQELPIPLALVVALVPVVVTLVSLVGALT